ncbi:hypothetical protein HYH03_003500 [Edaphochlamys debaryana]|uniref:DAGKc domain-containing protein n=1 Tax=Edaphochlamys debaryana TaxID=47281 RepID=A0A836C360_9CHLO|nr:hypothetical protein HYH03_003500 [Edaphochlamys debaryana]|eukprot:KAG2498761.1 hypothetical protein HYH03_003500 [Edaphochlamys debaryana]
MLRGVRVKVKMTSTHIAWKPVNTSSSCCGRSKAALARRVPFDEILSAQALSSRPSASCCLPRDHKFVVYTFTRARSDPNTWRCEDFALSAASPEQAREWAAAINARVQLIRDRPRNLLVFVNPFSGARRARSVWERDVEPVFQKARIKSNVVDTTKQDHAKEVVCLMKAEELASYHGIVVVGGDGMFQEVVSGLLARRERGDAAAHRIRIGHVPAGSTDAVAYTLHGSRCAATAALHIALGDRLALDCGRAEVSDGGEARTFVCQAGYGFMGDVMRFSERLRCMGPVRYDVTGALQYLRLASYRVALSYKEAPSLADAQHICTAQCQVCRAAGIRMEHAPPYARSSSSFSHQSHPVLGGSSPRAPPPLAGAATATAGAPALGGGGSQQSLTAASGGGRTSPVAPSPSASGHLGHRLYSLPSAPVLPPGPGGPGAGSCGPTAEATPSQQPGTPVASGPGGVGIPPSGGGGGGPLSWLFPVSADGRVDAAGGGGGSGASGAASGPGGVGPGGGSAGAMLARVHSAQIVGPAVAYGVPVLGGSSPRSATGSGLAPVPIEPPSPSGAPTAATVQPPPSTPGGRASPLPPAVTPLGGAGNGPAAASGGGGGSTTGMVPPAAATAAAAGGSSESAGQGLLGQPWTDAEGWTHLEGEFVSVKCVVTPCRSDKSKNGIIPHGHLSDGRMYLVLVSTCHHLAMLRFLLRLSTRGLVDRCLPHVRVIPVTALRLSPLPGGHTLGGCLWDAGAPESAWNVDGELLSGADVAVTVQRGAVEVFARGPETAASAGVGVAPAGGSARLRR